jgi:hypothetical protein
VRFLFLFGAGREVHDIAYIYILDGTEDSGLICLPIL